MHEIKSLESLTLIKKYLKIFPLWSNGGDNSVINVQYPL